MSRIGKLQIDIPSGVQISTDASNVVTVKGPKGQLTQQVDPDMGITIEDGVLKVQRPTEQKRHKAMHGLYRSLINNMVIGVSEGYTKQLEFVGVGFRAESQGQLLMFSVGFSHPIYFYVPEEVKIVCETVKGKNPIVTLTSMDKQLLGQVAAKIRAYRKPEPYKGKGIKFVGEELRRKAGKTAGK